MKPFALFVKCTRFDGQIPIVDGINHNAGTWMSYMASGQSPLMIQYYTLPSSIYGLFPLIHI